MPSAKLVGHDGCEVSSGGAVVGNGRDSSAGLRHYHRVLTYAAVVVVVLMGVAGVGRTTIGRALAAAIGGRFVESHDPHALHATAAAALGRRDHLIVRSSPLAARDRQAVRSDLRPVRFVYLGHQPADLEPPADAVIDAAWPPDQIVDAIRREFGL